VDVVRVILEPICARPWLVGVRSCVYSTCENVSGLPLQFGFIPTQAVQAVTPPRPLSVSRPPGAWTHWLGVLAFAIGVLSSLIFIKEAMKFAGPIHSAAGIGNRYAP
jgi:hypothetical protein